MNKLFFLIFITAFSFIVNIKFDMQAQGDESQFNLKEGYLKLMESVDNLVSDNRAIMKDVITIMRENKEIIIRLTNLENAAVKSCDFDNLKKEVIQIKESINLTNTEALISRIQKVEESTDEINKVFVYVKNAQTKLEMKTVEIETNLKKLEIIQQDKILEVLNKLDAANAKLTNEIISTNSQLGHTNSQLGATNESMRSILRFGGLFQIDDCGRNNVVNPKTGGHHCPGGYTQTIIGRIKCPESGCGGQIFLCHQ